MQSRAPIAEDDNRPERIPSAPKWHRYAWFVGLGVLAVITIHAIRQFVVGDWAAVADYWRSKLAFLPLIFGLAAVDLALEGVAWIWVAERFGLKARDRTGVRVFMAGNAGKVMPAQLGRLIRPEAMVRLRRGTVGNCFKAEGTVFVFDVISVAAILAGLGAYLVHPVVGLLALVGVIGVSLYLGERIADALSDTRLELPRDFWWRWESLAIVMIQLTGWVAHGLAFYVLIIDLPGSMGLWDALFQAPASAVVGSATGLPGGVGATEGALGVGLRLNGVPASYLVVVVAALRLVTLWIWVALGWVFLLGLRKKTRRSETPPIAFPATADESWSER